MVYLGIGSNIGDRIANLREAVRQLKKSFDITEISSVYETLPWGNKDQDNFYNIVCSTVSDIDIHDLLATIKTIEDDMGRIRSIHWGPRIIDIDILIIDNIVVDDNSLCVPHRYLKERDFFLRPLIEIAPKLKDTKTGRYLTSYLDELDSSMLTIIRIINEQI